MHKKTENIKKIFIIILTIIVSFIVLYALYVNKSKFYNPETIRYSRITIDENNSITEVVSVYSDHNSKDKFISEVKKINNLNNLNNESVYGKTLFIPVIEN